MLKRLVINKQEKMKIAVYHIGYSSEGESNIFILYGEDKDIYYSMAIDCYEESQCNITDSILEEWGIAEKKLDMLIWTHPHVTIRLALFSLLKNTAALRKLRYVLLTYLARQKEFQMSAGKISSFWVLCFSVKKQ